MANVKGSSSFRNGTINGKHSSLPPKCPFPSISPSYFDYVPGPVIGPKGFARPREVNSHHLRHSSESILVEEQPSWLDELLNEPETPARKGAHRRASSDSFTYIDIAHDFRNKNMISVPSWGSLDVETQNDGQYASLFLEPKPFMKPKNQAWDQSLSSIVRCSSQEADRIPSSVNEKQDQVGSDPQDPKAASEKNNIPNPKTCSLETDTKRAKQQFAQRSRVRKLQYIAELERAVQALQAEGCEVTAQLEFVNQQNLILSMENKALKQRLDSLAQEHLIKHMEHEVLEREIGRLRVMFQQQQIPPSSGLRRSNSKDFDAQFANLSLKLKDTNPVRDPIAGPLRI